MTCILISSAGWSMPTTVDIPLHDLVVFTSPLLQLALGGTASISEEDLSIFWKPRMIRFTHTVTAPRVIRAEGQAGYE